MSLVAVGADVEHPHPDSARLAPTHPARLNHPLSTAKSRDTAYARVPGVDILHEAIDFVRIQI